MIDRDYPRPMYEGYQTDSFDRHYLWHYRGRVADIKDGDTCSLLVDTGFRGRHEPAIRLAGVFAPERNEPGGREATARIRKVLITSDIPGQWPLRLVVHQKETIVTEVTTFERWVGDIYIDVQGGLRHLGGILAEMEMKEKLHFPVDL